MSTVLLTSLTVVSSSASVYAQTAQQAALYRKYEIKEALPSGFLSDIADFETRHGTILPLIGNLEPVAVCDRDQLRALIHVAANTSVPWKQFRTNSKCAMGLMQWRPLSWLEWGIDADGKNGPNPLDEEDAIATTAHFFAVRIRQVGLYRALLHYTGTADYALLLFNKYQKR